MFMLMMMSMMIMLISFFFMKMSSILSKKMNLSREKNSPYECGFDPKSSTRIPFSLNFFLITIMFLIFDVEIVLLFPIINIINNSNLINWLISISFFIMILIMGLYHEWNQGALEWMN